MYLKGLLIFVISLFFICGLEVKAYSDIDYISIAEQNLFSTQFKAEPVNNRLNRLEIDVFGKINSKDTAQQRVQKLKKALGDFNNTSQPTQSIKPIPENKAKITPQNALAQYPMVDEIEKQVLNKTFQQEDIYKRLDRLELVIFNQNFNDPLNNRVERLKTTVIGSQNNSISSNNHNQANSLDNSTMPIDSESINVVLSQLEKQTFNTVYQNEPVETRIDRLENHVFNQTSPEDDTNSRVERLATVIAAQPANELYKDMSQLRQYQSVGTGLTAAALIMMLIKGFFF
ncbi:MAG: hypothetical protein A2287_06720 [Candidatus Melainabacteria bacterium RIFOXYA12_FULL_32_12]|nr:MAG: hypothetical protein A2287_06720 [Candidatus Melainabacteria bacterium RIFOXYA12_FULL_32_12]